MIEYPSARTSVPQATLKYYATLQQRDESGATWHQGLRARSLLHQLFLVSLHGFDWLLILVSMQLAAGSSSRVTEQAVCANDITN